MSFVWPAFLSRETAFASSQPVRAERFSAERLEEHARSLAAAQPTLPRGSGGQRLIGRLAENERVLLTAYRATARLAEQGATIGAGAEWLLDNYFLVETQIQAIRTALPARYCRQLPRLSTGPFKGYPRVVGVAWAFVAHTDSHFDTEALRRYLRAYQEVNPLTIGELWAIAITLRMVLLENLRRLAERMVQDQVAQAKADAMADRLLGTASIPPEPVSDVLHQQQGDALSPAFAVQLAYRLRDQDPNVTPALIWLDQLVASATDSTIDVVVRDEHLRQGATGATMRNIITSLRLIADVDWTELFERVSLVDDALAQDAAYLEMDFATRNLYRTAIEQLSRSSAHTELEVAHAAVQAARRAGASDADPRAADAGYHLIANGRPAFEAEIGFRTAWTRRLARANRGAGIGLYVGAIVITAMMLLALPLYHLAGLHGLTLALLAILGAVPAVDLAVQLVNTVVMRCFGATALPGMELRHGIGPQHRTLVAVPMLLTTDNAILEQVERLEVHYLTSPPGEMYFALISDWTDAAGEHAEGDTALLMAATQGIAALNQRHGAAPDGGARFLLLHRRRLWNEGERRWIGWERKRGKLHELNRLLRGAGDTSFVQAEGEAPVPSAIRYVITLDADTRLPRDAVCRLIGKMAHPLNRPRFDAKLGRVVEGYAVLQPRVTPSLPIGDGGSLFQRVFSSESGIDPYSSAVSDVYQDLFGEGSYAGKGIYDIDAFEAALADRVPDSTLLSHDLFEGVFARAGLATDIEVVEEFPSRYDVAARRSHRWARGDWQLLPWMTGSAIRASGSDPRSRVIPGVGRWKMWDNLRRTLSAPASVAALLIGWTLPLDAALIWTGFILATIMGPALMAVVLGVLAWRQGITLSSHIRALGHELWLAVSLSFLLVTFLADQACLMGDAIGRVLFRLFVTRRKLLEWITAAQSSTDPHPGLPGFHRGMAGALVTGGVALGVGVAAGSWPVAAPFALLWLASPCIAYWVSLPPHLGGRLRVRPEDAASLRRIARRTWHFFESFVTPNDNMLPPDNFQEDPRPVIAHRTSPTNIGLYLLSVASAREFGWIGTQDATLRLEATMATMQRLERFRGHFYNWYGTQDLRPLDPRYISTVDSGNLAGHLIALANACRQWRETPAAPPLSGIADTLDLAQEAAARLRQTSQLRSKLESAIASLAADLRGAPVQTSSPEAHLAGLAAKADAMVALARALCCESSDDHGAEILVWAEATAEAIQSHERDRAEDTRSISARLQNLEDTARAMAVAMEFGFLLDRDRKLFSIGYLVAEAVCDPSCYDLLASEARLASFFAIAKGDVPGRHWFRLGRAVTPVGSGTALMSWSGSMFEYLMPSLVMRAPAGSLIEQSNRLAVRRQIEHGNKLGLPWGISESAYNARDREFTYQYSNFGVPSLGLKRGLAESTVIAPYATALAAMVNPQAAARNFSRLAGVGALGRHGFYEALDYTPARVQMGRGVAIVRAFMAHHQGMTIVAIADTLLAGVMRARFHAEPMVQAAELLLQERTTRDVAVVRPRAVEVSAEARLRKATLAVGRRYTTPHAAATHLLSNGSYAVMLTSTGSGYSRWNNMAVTRWREDPTCDDHGSYIFLRDTGSGAIWSAGYQPSGAEPDAFEVMFHEDRAEFTRRDGTLTTTMEVLVSAEDDSEVRRVTLSNSGRRTREIEITSYAELALAVQAADVAHPVFSKLFVETEFLAEFGAIIATRRKRAGDEPGIWAAHVAVCDSHDTGDIEIETDRLRFLGRGGTARWSRAMQPGAKLSGTVGTVLDPVFALRRRVRIAPGTQAQVTFWTMVAPTREALLGLLDIHRDAAAFDRTTSLAWTQAQVQLRHLGINQEEAGLFQSLAQHVVQGGRSPLRPASEVISRGAGPQPGLWGLGISGDLPIVLLRITDIEDVNVARQLLLAQSYWRMKRLAVDLVVLNERASSYVQDLQNAIETLVRTSQARNPSEEALRPGSVFLLRSDLLAPETAALLVAVARVVLVAARGSMADQLSRLLPAAPALRRPPRALPRPASVGAVPVGIVSPVPANLEFFNGLGGFAEQGREYVTILGPGQNTPLPWINVIANPGFGFLVSAEGGGSTWAVNSRENQLTPWSNDPVSNRAGEAFYLRDEETGAVWSPTAYPIRDPAGIYVARHGRGYSRFEHSAHGIAAELLQLVPLEDPVKISRLRLRNLSGRARQLSVTSYVEWVLGLSRGATAPFVVTELDGATGGMFARNPWSADFGRRVAFADLGGRRTGWTGDRGEFIGRGKSLTDPAAMAGGAALSNKVGAGLDPCSALRSSITLAPGASVDLVFLLGQAEGAEAARDLVRRYRDTDPDLVLADIGRHWDAVLGTVQVHTPDRSLDIMLNGWLLYQSLACRVWARTGFYQASGAYGFRDQLQDGMALVGAQPALTREHLLRASGRQFVEGDVQHWWLPHSGQGVRTRISDDRVWLALATAHYVSVTGDAAILAEQVSFLEGQKLAPGEHEMFFQPTTSDTGASLLEHCARGLDSSLGLGAHGLPLIGGGDWNDGMSRVGEHGQGESVWLGWMLCATIAAFAPLAEAHGEHERAAAWRAHAVALQGALESQGWDGDWYRRGFYDDGTPLGSATSEECRIDSIAQSWAVLSRAGDPARAAQAMAAMERELIRPDEGVALLFAPPFDQTPLDPGYIKGYPPGIRENGGQYTHAGLWAVMAFAALGDGDRAMGLLAMLNPINHARTLAEVERYKVEPYVVAADVYGVAPHVGRGGWTWYTGSAGWMQRAGMESILGLRRRGETLMIDPCIPKAWPGFSVTLLNGTALYLIKVENPHGVSSGIATATLDGVAVAERPLVVSLVNDGASHSIEVTMGAA